MTLLFFHYFNHKRIEYVASNQRAMRYGSVAACPLVCPNSITFILGKRGNVGTCIDSIQPKNLVK